MTSVSETLPRLPRRMQSVVREHEILRVAGVMPAEAVGTAIDEVLAWAQKRSGGQLPAEAWEHGSFDYFSGGRNSSCVRLRSGDSDIWAIRTDDPDKTVPGRIWTNEVVVGSLLGQPAKFSVRQIVGTSESELPIEPHTPGFVQQVAKRCLIMNGSDQLSAEPRVFETSSDAEDLVTHLIDTARQLPTIVFSLPEGGYGEHPTIDVAALGRAVLGLGHVAVAHSDAAWQLTRAFGKSRSVFGGAARIYLPGFSADSDPYVHRLVLASQMGTAEDAARTARWMRQLVATESVRRAKLGREVLPYAEIRGASLKLRQQELHSEDASEGEQLAAANERIAELEKQVASLTSEQEYYVAEYEKERERAEISEAQSQRGAYRIQQLTEQLKNRGDNPDQDIALPASWAELADWCDEKLAGLLVLTPNAARGIRKPLYEDFETTARCLHWLATDCRDQRMHGGGSPMSNVTIMEGIQNASCGADVYYFDWGGRSFSADWHIKNGGNTRDPSRCLRIYYCFDEQTQQIIVSDMPAHRRTGAS